MPGEHDARSTTGRREGVFRSELLQLRPQGVHFVALDTFPTRRRASASRSSRGSSPTWRNRRRTRASSSSRTGRSSICIRNGTGDTRRGAGDRPPHAPQERHRVLRPHPPGASPDDRHIAHHSAKSLIFPLPAPARSPSASRSAGIRRSRIEAWASARRRGRAGGRVRDHEYPVKKA